MMLMWLIPVVLVIALLGSNDGSRASKGWLTVTAVLIALPVLGWFTMMGGYGMGMYRSYWGGSWNWPWSIFNLAMLAALLVLGYFALKRFSPGETEEQQLLRLRLAKGEISPEEFDLLREKLRR